MAVDKALISGSMTMLLLRLLAEKDMYGYEMIDTLRKKSCNVFELKAGTLYPLLHGLEGKDCLRYMSRNMLVRRGSIIASRKREEHCWKQRKQNGTNINLL